MGRFYTIPIDAVAVTVAQDLFEIKAASAKPFFLHEIVLSQHTDYGDAQAEGLRIRIKRATGSYTSGSGGTTPTAQKHNTSDASCGATLAVNNTTQATAGTGALTVLRPEAFNEQAGHQYLPAPEQRPFFAGGEGCVIDLPTAPADSITVSGCAVIEELG